MILTIVEHYDRPIDRTEAFDEFWLHNIQEESRCGRIEANLVHNPRWSEYHSIEPSPRHSNTSFGRIYRGLEVGVRVHKPVVGRLDVPMALDLVKKLTPRIHDYR
jgi:hypothetical protein